jgi:hypothetical protein
LYLKYTWLNCASAFQHPLLKAKSINESKSEKLIYKKQTKVELQWMRIEAQRHSSLPSDTLPLWLTGI